MYFHCTLEGRENMPLQGVNAEVYKCVLFRESRGYFHGTLLYHCYTLEYGSARCQYIIIQMILEGRENMALQGVVT